MLCSLLLASTLIFCDSRGLIDFPDCSVCRLNASCGGQVLVFGDCDSGRGAFKRGWTDTVDPIVRLGQKLDEIHPQTVVIELDVNDYIHLGKTPDEEIAQQIAMGDLAVSKGVIPIFTTSYPAGGTNYMLGWWTGVVREKKLSVLRALGFAVIDTASAQPISTWAACTKKNTAPSDYVHPRQAWCKQAWSDFVAAAQ
jgi:hypothetical protein